MAVKCRPQMRRREQRGAIHNALRRSSSCHARSAAEASTTPIAIAGTTRAWSQTRMAGIMRACMPAKCMRAMPATDDGTAGDSHRPAAARRDGKAGQGHHGRDQQRRDRQGRIVVGGIAWVVGEHGHEVGGPDASAGTHGGQEHPGQVPRALLAHGIGIGVEGRDLTWPRRSARRETQAGSHARS